MDIESDLHQHWRQRGSYLNHMVHCSDDTNDWIQDALFKYLPIEIFKEHKDNFAFLSTEVSDAFRIAPQLRQRECIVLSERVIPPVGSPEYSAETRYFMFVILHEVAHAIKKHKSPLFDQLTSEESKAQENEADALAYQWFNEYAGKFNEVDFPPITKNEIELMQSKNQQIMKRD